MNPLNEFFDKIYCVNLDRRPDRWSKCSEQFEKLDIVVERFSAVDKYEIENNTNITTGQLACLLSHLSILKKSRNENLQKILIFEDDVVLSGEILEIFKINKDNIPDDWCMLYLGGNHLNGKEHVQGDIHKMVATLTTHAYGLKDNMYDIIIQNIKQWVITWPQPLDVYYAAFHRKFPCYVIQNKENQLSWQDSGYSDIDESECDYTWLH
jgi:GR25 family glycosyltransferase involved in LPS biosynthesis